MAANYDIYFDAGDLKGVLDRIQQSEGGRRLAREDPGDVVVGGVGDATATRRELLQESLGIAIDANVWFKLDKFRLREAFDVVVAMFVRDLLPCPGDLALMANYERTLVRRRAGRLEVQRSGLVPWQHEAIERAFAGTPHAVIDLPNI
jgi:hypothetical protein